MIHPLKNPPKMSTVFGADPSAYKAYGLRGHHGVDFPVGRGTSAYAVSSGRVIVSQNGYHDPHTGNFISGNVLVLRDGHYDYWYMHLDQRLYGAGADVSEGMLIVKTGNTGAVSPKPTAKNPNAGAHLHFGIRPIQPDINNGFRGFIDPTPFLVTNTQAVPTAVPSAAPAGLSLKIRPGTWNVRSAPSLSGAAIGIALGGQQYAYENVDGWARIVFNGRIAFVGPKGWYKI